MQPGGRAARRRDGARTDSAKGRCAAGRRSAHRAGRATTAERRGTTAGTPPSGAGCGATGRRTAGCSPGRARCSARGDKRSRPSVRLSAARPRPRARCGSRSATRSAMTASLRADRGDARSPLCLGMAGDRTRPFAQLLEPKAVPRAGSRPTVGTKSGYAGFFAQQLLEQAVPRRVSRPTPGRKRRTMRGTGAASRAAVLCRSLPGSTAAGSGQSLVTRPRAPAATRPRPRPRPDCGGAQRDLCDLVTPVTGSVSTAHGATRPLGAEIRLGVEEPRKSVASNSQPRARLGAAITRSPVTGSGIRRIPRPRPRRDDGR